jgi:signal peptidase I
VQYRAWVTDPHLYEPHKDASLQGRDLGAWLDDETGNAGHQSGPPPDRGQPVDEAVLPPVDQAAPAQEVEEEPAEHHRSFWKELPFLILIALVIAVVIKTFVIQAFWIPSSSMEDTLEVNDRVLVNKLAYDIGEIERGDVIVFDDPRGIQERESVIDSVVRNLAESVGLSTPKSEFIKRVIGLPGDTVEVREGVVRINGEPLVEDYLHPRTDMPDFGPETVPPGQYFVMGDNRNSSQDSRFFGPIDEEAIVGKAFVVLWPPSRWSGM